MDERMTPAEYKASNARHVAGLAAHHLREIFKELEEHHGAWAELMLRKVLARMGDLHRAACDTDNAKVFCPPPKLEPLLMIDSCDIERAIAGMEA
jgi:hypothetical protein